MRELPGVNDLHKRPSAANDRITYIIKAANKAKEEVNLMAILSRAKTLEDVTRQEEAKEMIIEEAKEKNYNLNVSYVLHLDNEKDNIPEPEEEEER